MTDTRPGPDELRMRGILRDRGVGPAADESPLPPDLPDGFEPRERDWLDDILDSNPTEPASQPEGEPETAPVEKPTPPKRTRARKDKLKTSTGTGKTRSKADRHPATADPRKSLLDAIDGVSPRVRRLIANLTAAGLGWSLGWVDFAEDVVAWVRTHHPADPQSIFWYVVGAACLLLYGRSRSWVWPASWFASVPAASLVAGVLLYAPTQ